MVRIFLWNHFNKYKKIICESDIYGDQKKNMKTDLNSKF